MADLLFHEAIVHQLYTDPRIQRRLLELEAAGQPEKHLESFSQLVSTRTSSREPVAGWVRYREGYSPTLVQRLLEKYPMIDDTAYIFDPMCGSGSTQVAAQRLGKSSAGSDVSPYAVLVSRAKTQPWSASDQRSSELAIQRLGLNTGTGSPALNATDRYLQRYFPDHTLEKLVQLRDAIQNDPELTEAGRTLLHVAALAIVEDCSNRKKDGNGLATRPARVSDVWGAFITQATRMLRELGDTQPVNSATQTYVASAMNMDLTIGQACRDLDSPLGSIVFSPPYANSFDYYESYKLELLFGGFYDIGQLGAARSELIRSYRQSGKSTRIDDLVLVEWLITELGYRLEVKERESGKADGRARLLPNLLRGYFSDMREVMTKAFAMMPSGTYMHVIVDQSAYLGLPVPTDLLLADIGQGLGFEFQSLLVCRAAKTSGQQLKTQPLLKQVLREAVVVLRKP
jgi:hypothetical protein